ncbi:MAG: glycosyltransferase [Acidobacteria bacterium]|nr:MAG: glycosyltransferase [Acidobacteriota bacterium]
MVPRQLVSVVLPVYNEAATLAPLMQRLDQVTRALSGRYVFEFILVDDGSRDRTFEAAEEFAAVDGRVKVVALRRNYGQTAALQVGFDHAEGDIVISMDADLQHFPEDIPAFLERIEEGYDVVCGWRSDRREGVARRWPSRAANWLVRRLTGLTVHDVGTTFRAYQGDIVRQLRLLGEHHRFIPVLAKNLGAKITEVEIQNIERPSGASNYGLSRTLNVLLDIAFLVFYVKYLDRPIRIFGRLALACVGLAGIILAVLAYLTVVYHIPAVRERSGWFLLALVLLVSGVQFLLFGLVSEVVVRMYFYPGQAKPYLVRKISSRSVPTEQSESRSVTTGASR